MTNSVDQDADGDLNTQGTWVGSNAEAGSDQLVGSVTGNATGVAQNQEGEEGNYSQSADVLADADASVDGLQDTVAANANDVDQVASGGLNDQQADVDADASAEGSQLVGGASGNITGVAQTAEGVDSNFAQNAWVWCTLCYRVCS